MLALFRCKTSRPDPCFESKHFGRVRPHPRHPVHVEMQPNNAHAKRLAPHSFIVARRNCWSNGVVSRELARGGEKLCFIIMLTFIKAIVFIQVLRQLCQALTKCYTVAFENRASISNTHITPHTLNFVKKLVSTFGVGVENVSNVSQTFSSAASESLARRVKVGYSFISLRLNSY